MCFPSEAASSKSQFYDEVYFDSSESSDDEGEIAGTGEGTGPNGGGQRGPSGGRKRKVNRKQKLTNDDLFYDPNMDEEDEKWMNRKRMAYHNGEVCILCVPIVLLEGGNPVCVHNAYL